MYYMYVCITIFILVCVIKYQIEVVYVVPGALHTARTRDEYHVCSYECIEYTVYVYIYMMYTSVFKYNICVSYVCMYIHIYACIYIYIYTYNLYCAYRYMMCRNTIYMYTCTCICKYICM